MIAFFLGSIPFGANALVGPVGQSIEQQATYAEYAVTRGKPVLHEIGEELDTQTIDFFFSEEFCSPAAEEVKLQAAFALKTPMPLASGNGLYLGKRYVVESLSRVVRHTGRGGQVVRLEATIGLKEAPVPDLLGQIASVMRAEAPAIIRPGVANPAVRR